MTKLTVRSLKQNERRRLFEFARNLSERDFWGKKGRPLRGDWKRFQTFFNYIKPFQPKSFIVAEENNQLVGFVIAVYNPEWIDELAERYGHGVEKRAYILGIAFDPRRKDVLTALTDELANYFSKKGVKSLEYPTLGNVCLTTATDVLTPQNVDALLMFREAGFKISECYYSMKLNLDGYKRGRKKTIEEGSLRFKESSIEIVRENKVLGQINLYPVETGSASIDINVERGYRGKGLGTTLMAEALDLLRKRGIKVIELGVDGNNLFALKLYLKFGFEVYRTHFYIIKPCQHVFGKEQGR